MIYTGKPLIAATLHLEKELDLLPALAEEKIIDAVEFRADRLYRGEPEALLALLLRIKETGLPVILTFRCGEAAGVSEGKRLELIEKLLPGADAVDIELSSEITGRTVQKAKSLSRTVIISEHDFHRTPSGEALGTIFEKSMAAGADIVKIAVMPEGPRDAARLMAFCLENSPIHPLICISMGEAGRFTRFYAPFFGSSITYGFVSSPAAPGQVDARELKRELAKYF